VKQLYASQLPKDVRDLLDTLVSKINDLQTQLEEVKGLMAISEADFIVLSNKVDTIEGKITDLTTQLGDLQGQITAVQSGADDSILTLQEADITFTTTISTLQQADTDFTSDLEALRTEKAADVETLAAADTTLSSQIQSVLVRIQAIETKHLAMAVRDLDLSITEVSADITLPDTDEYESAIVWATSDATYLTADGVVTRPAFDLGNVDVTLTATLTYGQQIGTKDFIVTVLALAQTDQAKLDLDAPALSLASFDEDGVTDGIQVTSSKVMPTTVGTHGTTVAWASSDITYFDINGTVVRPAYGNADASVTLTATLTNGTATTTQDFVVTVLAETVMPDQMKADEDAAALSIASFDEDAVTGGTQVTTSKVMPSTGDVHVSTITWASDDIAHFGADGTVVRPLFGEPDATVTLTATLTNGIATATQTFTVTVLAEIA
jgi:hypothetical protein